MVVCITAEPLTVTHRASSGVSDLAILELNEGEDTYFPRFTDKRLDQPVKARISLQAQRSALIVQRSTPVAIRWLIIGTWHTAVT